MAHNFAHSFASVMNYADGDCTMCHLIRRAKLTGTRRLRLDVIARTAGPIELLSPPIVQACENYCKDFGRLVTSSGSALDMIDRADLEVVVAIGRQIGAGGKTLHGRVTARIRIRDDRGRFHEGRSVQAYECSDLR